MASISLADELVILLIFANTEHFDNGVTVGKVSHANQMQMQTLRGHWAGNRSNLAKAIICVYKNEINSGHFEHLM